MKTAMLQKTYNYPYPTSRSVYMIKMVQISQIRNVGQHCNFGTCYEEIIQMKIRPGKKGYKNEYIMTVCQKFVYESCVSSSAETKFTDFMLK